MVNHGRIRRVELDLEIDGDPIRGRLLVSGAGPVEFVGVLELIAFLDQVRGPEIPAPKGQTGL